MGESKKKIEKLTNNKHGGRGATGVGGSEGYFALKRNTCGI